MHLFINIRLPGSRASVDSRWPPSSDSTLMFQKRVNFKIRWSPTSALVQMICKIINKKEMGLPSNAKLSMQNKPNKVHSFAILQCFAAESGFLSNILSVRHHKICTHNIALASVSRHDDVRTLR